jgi:hypothetical protein
MTTALAFAEARDQVQTWKHVEIVRFTVALLTAAAALRRSGIYYVGSDDVDWQPLPELASDSTIHSVPGSAIAAARNAGILQDNYGNDPANCVFGGRRRSKRESANGRKVPTYTVNWWVADEYLRRHGTKVQGPQQELFA